MCSISPENLFFETDAPCGIHNLHFDMLSNIQLRGLFQESELRSLPGGKYVCDGDLLELLLCAALPSVHLSSSWLKSKQG